MQVKISQAVRMITTYVRAGIVPMLIGSPGCGKSQVVHQIAQNYNLKLIDLRLSQCDPTDLSGFPTIIEGKKADYLPMAHFPIESDPLPEGYAGWLIFLDEFNSAPPAIQTAAYKLILDKMVGAHHLHPKVAMVAAGNKETDNAIVQPMSTALQSRLAHLELIVDAAEWREWAYANGIDHRITSYNKFKPGNTYTFSPDHTDHTYACPRTWAYASKVLDQNPDKEDLLPMLAGVISEGVAREFIGFTKIYDSLPKTEALIRSPESAVVPSEPSVLYALTGSIAHHITQDNAKELMTYVKRLPVEFQVVTMKEIRRRDVKMLAAAPVRDWIATSAVELF